MSPKLFLVISLGVVILTTSSLAEKSDNSLNGGHGNPPRKGRKHPRNAKEFTTTQERKQLNPDPKGGPHKPPRDHGDHHDQVQDRDDDRDDGHGYDHDDDHDHDRDDHDDHDGDDGDHDDDGDDGDHDDDRVQDDDDDDHDHDHDRHHDHHHNPRRPPHKGHPHSLIP